MSVRINRLGQRGEGIADGPIYVPGALPGEVVEGEVRDGRIHQPRILEPVPDRVRAPCRHYKRCGACSLQHASDSLVADWKIARVTSALAAHGIDAPVVGMHTSPPATRRRATLAARRTKSGAEVGFHARGSDQVVPVPDCLVLHPRLMALWPVFEEVTRLFGSRKGTLKLAVTVTETGVDLVVGDGKPADPATISSLAPLVDGSDIARVTVGDDIILTRAAPIITFGTAPVPIPPGAFLQATADGEAALVASVTQALDGITGKTADLFAGCGTFALPLAATREVHAVEGDGALLRALDAGWRGAKGLRHVTTERRDLFRRPLLPDELKSFAAIVIDPPRAGAEAQIAQIATAGPDVIAMVSCNPVTFARDAAALIAGGYGLEWLRVVDQFRWSSHVELAARFYR